MKITQIFAFQHKVKHQLPLYVEGVSAGFPSAADDYIETKLDLNEHLIKHPAATFFVRVEGSSMIKAGIQSGDILIVDRALEAGDNQIVIALINGEFTVKRISHDKNKVYLTPANPAFQPIEVTSEMDFEVWGVVTYVIHQAK
ncbi:MAG TPA: translesion error-prone DNA polymerase V autoproteolytic subunit [Patescibacteria group bacterium]